MLRFEGDKECPLAPAELWCKLTDACFLAQCIPGVETVAQADPDQVVCTLRPGFSFARGTLELTLRVIDKDPGRSAGLLLHTRGIGSTSDVTAHLEFTPSAGGTRVSWRVEIKALGGLLKAVPQGLVQASAQKVIADAWGAVEQHLQ